MKNIFIEIRDINSGHILIWGKVDIDASEVTKKNKAVFLHNKITDHSDFTYIVECTATNGTSNGIADKKYQLADCY